MGPRERGRRARDTEAAATAGGHADRLVAALVVLVAAAAFLPAVGNGFVSWDDDRNFLDNPHYRGLAPPQLWWMLTTPHTGLYIPVTWLTLGLDWLLWGLDPRGYHLTSLLFHAATAAVFFAVARRLLASALPAAGGAALRLGAAAAALLFAVHPLRVESVAWATERRDVVSGLLYALALLLYLRATATTDGEARRRAVRRTLWVFAAALLAKPMAVSLPVILLVLDVYPLRRLAPRAPDRGVLREKLPFVALAAAGSAVAVWAMLASGRMSTPGELGLPERLAISGYSLAFYLWKMLWPAALAPLYELPFGLRPAAWPYAVSAGVVLASSAAAVALRRRWPAFAAAWLAYVVILLPVVGLAHQGPQIAADRFTYLASLPWALLAGGGLAWGWARVRAAGARATLAAATLVVVLALGALTWRQIGVWRDSETLWSHALATSPSAIAHAKLGVLRDEQGQPERAIEHFRAALAIHPDLAYAHNNWGIALARQGKWDEAIAHYREALALAPASVETHLNLAVTLDRANRPAEAARHLREAQRLGGERR